LQIKKQETIKKKITEEVKMQYEEMKDENIKVMENKINELKNNQMAIDKKILKIENEIKYNIQYQYISGLSNFIKTK